MATVYFSVLRLVDIVEALERLGAFIAAEALGVPGTFLRQLSLHLESLPSAPSTGGRIISLALQTQRFLANYFQIFRVNSQMLRELTRYPP